MRLRATVLPILLVGLAGAGGWFARGLLAPAPSAGAARSPEHEAEASETSVEVTTVAAEEGEVPVTIACSGVARAADGVIAAISSRAGGRVLAIAARVGDDVAAGAPLVRLETAALELALVQARSAATLAENQFAEFDRSGRDRRLAELQSSVDQARADVTVTTAQVDRLGKLKDDGLSSEKARSEAERAAGTARRDLEAATRGLDAYRTTEADLQRSTLVSARDAAAAAVKDAEAVLLDAEVRAPVPGRVLAFAARPGDRVEPGAELGTLLRGDAREIAFAILASQVSSIPVAARVTWTDRGGAARTARVRAVVPRVEPGLGLVDVLVVPDDAGPVPYPGEFLRGEVEVRRVSKAVVVPSRAVVRAEDRRTVLVVSDGIARHVEVEVVAQHDGRAAVSGKVAPGDAVVVDGAYNLPEGAHVRVAEPKAPDGDAK